MSCFIAFQEGAPRDWMRASDTLVQSAGNEQNGCG